MIQRPGTRLAVMFEGGLAVAALLIAAVSAWWLDVPIWDQWMPTLAETPASMLRGLAATLPMLAAFFMMLRANLPAIVRLKRQMIAMVRTLLGGATVAELALVAALAGVGEELLFRGVLQPLAAHWATPLAGLVVASILFGLAHSLSWLYFVFATVIGFYFGWLADAYGDVLAPAVAHGVYDFVALVWVLKRRPASSERG